MRYTERREFLYDPKLFGRGDVAMALRLHDEYVTRHAARPAPRCLEADRSPAQVDQLWHQPVNGTTQFLRELEIPCLVLHDKKVWNPETKTAQAVSQRMRFWFSNLALQRADYFPLPGDIVIWGGYRHEIVAPEFEPSCFWQQTNVWLGIVYSATLATAGDNKPALNAQRTAPAEKAAGFKIVMFDPSAKPVVHSPAAS